MRALATGLLLAAAAAPLRADPSTARASQQTTLGLFNSAQELPPFSPDQLTARRKLLDDDEAAAADTSLNDWKLCVTDALVRWSVLKPGVGTLVDGAFGRCADLERDYRDHLMRITQGSRNVVDVQMARGMTRLLEDVWRPRLIAQALDQELARQTAPPNAPPVRATAPEAPGGSALRGTGNGAKQPPRAP